MTLTKFSLVAALMACAAFPAVSQVAAPVADALDAVPTAGDAEAGGVAFGKQCVTCHVVVNDAGETLAGRNAKTGPNLYNVAGRKIGSMEGFRYGNGIKAVHAMDMNWDEEKFVGYVQDPTSWLRETSGDKKVRGKMSYKVRKEEDAQNIYAYLYSLANPS